MKYTMLVLLIAGAVILGVPAAYAHHSFAATYFEDKTVTIEGEPGAVPVSESPLVRARGK